MREKIFRLKILLGIVAFLLIMVVISIIVLHGTNISQRKNKNITIQVIDGHEYIVTGYKGGICHKENCAYCEEEK